jgi:hypothetical protein
MLTFEQHVDADSHKIRIGILYNKYLDNYDLPLVKTYNQNTNEFEYKKIIKVNSDEKYIIRITCGNREIKCTKEHKFLTEKGWVESNNLCIGDLIKTTSPSDHHNYQILRSYNEDQKQIILGSFLGDGNIGNHGLNRYRLRVIHGIKQKEYCEWMASIFKSKIEYIDKNGYSQTPAVRFASRIFGLSNNFPKVKNTCPQWILDNLDARGLAIWFMDDGSSSESNIGATLSTCSFDENSQIRIINKLQLMGINSRYVFHNMKGRRYPGYYSIYLKKDGYLKLCKLVQPYIHQNLKYKINSKYFQNVGGYIWNNNFNNYGLVVVDKVEFLDKKEKVYNLEIEDNYNFIMCSQSRKASGGLITK